MARVVVVGAGAMGLAAAYHAGRRGHAVTVLEAAPEPGGMAAHLDLAGLSIERFYHFVCRADRPTFDLMSELGLGDRMRWVPTSMGYYVDGSLHPWGDPVSLLRFPGLSFVEKLRYGAMMAIETKRRDWRALDTVSARDWITRWCGARVYERMWAPLFRLKFFQHADTVSAAWIWTRIRRLGTSRRSLFQEELGYIEGGSQTLVDALVAAVERQGGTVRCGVPVERIDIAEGAVAGVTAGGEVFPADAVICTVPTPHVSALVPAMPAAERARYDAIENIGVVCVLVRLKRSITPHFWVNIADPRFAIPGIVEFSNLRPTGDTVVYVPYYMPPDRPEFSRDDATFRAEALGCLKMLQPALRDEDVVAVKIGRLRHAQPVCPPGFSTMLPPVETSVRGLQIADTAFYYPEDRGIAESVRLGREMAERVP
ncbi:NAD(P)/FAD-dependent oxidoreductase [Rhodoplanes sp. TEM]|uniref:NAD(P)/FAD-dependent oxidoreductase n=1 Tax=Rhodoplanes tepidamans TaxID=200616 RepID=A0ABT5JDD7_RHOTP|nr:MULTISPECIES: NAD(P)/FAD-dependent oxidoreductase [Rhodoplanes]MDC7787690.1 NAD(P)/FAD-dependent oxidoreductase [Rhodoplanes tepidamans]MDC7983064.1 NAD(P)/FAD-dependent oxidoreductase [Rhodoplanes sp. TEM]MDQ0356446.1 protoporphyrinogen oxidase [Rhodoplanes tepidamans]